MRKIISAVSAVAFLGGCTALPASTQTDVANFIAGLNNKLGADFQVALKTASTPVPGAPGGYANQPWVSCLNGSGGAGSVNGLIGLQKTIQPILANATAQGGGVVTAAVVVDTFNLNAQPVQGWIQGLIGSDCGALLAKNGIQLANANAALASIAATFAIPLAASNEIKPVVSVALNAPR